MARGKRKITTAIVVKVLQVPDVPEGVLKEPYDDASVLVGTWLPFYPALDMLGQGAYPDGTIVRITHSQRGAQEYMVRQPCFVPCRYNAQQGRWVLDYSLGKVITGLQIDKYYARARAGKGYMQQFLLDGAA